MPLNKKKVAHKDLSKGPSWKYFQLFWPAVQGRPANLAGSRPATGFGLLSGRP